MAALGQATVKCPTKQTAELRFIVQTANHLPLLVSVLKAVNLWKVQISVCQLTELHQPKGRFIAESNSTHFPIHDTFCQRIVLLFKRNILVGKELKHRSCGKRHTLKDNKESKSVFPKQGTYL